MILKFASYRNWDWDEIERKKKIYTKVIEGVDREELSTGIDKNNCNFD